MSPNKREAALWLGGALVLALVIVVWALLSMPELDALTERYSVL